MYGPYRSPIVADRPLSPATRRCLGEPLPHQQADRTQAPLKVGSYSLYSPSGQENPNIEIRICLFKRRDYGVLPNLSASYSPPRGRFPRVTHPSAANPPKRTRSTCIPKARR